MDNNESPIDLASFQEDQITKINTRILYIFTRKTMRARDCIRTHWNTLNHNTPYLTKRMKDIFFDDKVSDIINKLEFQSMDEEWKQSDMQNLVIAVYEATNKLNRYTDPFSLIPQF